MTDKLVFVFPTLANKARVWAYRQDFLARGDSLDGTMSLGQASDYESWLAEVEGSHAAKERYKGFVPGTQYLAVRERDGALVGMANIRHYLDERLLRHGGSIGYSVRFAERNKGYGSEILRMALPIIKSLGQSRALVTCFKENLGSQGVILHNGGKFCDEFIENGRTTQRYWIDLA